MKKLILLLSTLVAITVLSYFIISKQYGMARQELTPPLKSLASEKGITIGNFAIATRLNEEPYRKILVEQFNHALIDNTPNWYFTDGGLRPTKDSFSFSQMDSIVQFAMENNMKIQAHHYVWGEEKWLPDWLKNGNYTKEQLYTLIEEHIHTVGTRYAGKIDEWTVVNEAFSRGQNINNLRDWWGDHTGSKEYIDKAFLAAQKADPNSALILNDFGNEVENSISNEMYEYIKQAKVNGIPIDGIGMQMHINGASPPSKEDVIKNMQRFSTTGVDVYITEFDVTMNDVAGTTKEKEEKQAKIYYDMMRACIESKVCKSFAILGITDKETWYNYVGQENAMPLPFDENYNPKPAYFSLFDALLNT